MKLFVFVAKFKRPGDVKLTVVRGIVDASSEEGASDKVAEAIGDKFGWCNYIAVDVVETEYES